MSVRTQGRKKTAVVGEHKFSSDLSELRAYTEAYQAMLARELLINNFEEEYCKYF